MTFPFAVKVVWFGLSLTGLLSSTFVLHAFARAVHWYWAPGLYLLGSALLQLPFCLGIIWHMDPYEMPRDFCYFQTLIMGFAANMITGVTTSFAMATNACVSKPRIWKDDIGSVLKWQNVYLIPVLVCPLLTLIADAVVVVKLQAPQPVDGLQCDSTSPLWARFLSYAGFPLLFSLPGIYYSVESVIKLHSIEAHIRRSRPSNNTTTSVQFRKWPFFGKTPQAHTARISTASPIPTHSAAALSTSSTDRDDLSVVSDSFPTFASPPSTSNRINNMTNPHGPADFELVQASQGANHRPIQIHHTTFPPSSATSVDDAAFETSKAEHEIDIEIAGSSKDESDILEDLQDRLSHRREFDAAPWDLSLSREHRKPPPPSLAPAVWRVMLFQMLVIVIQAFAALSTVIDISRHSPKGPMAFGTHHIALALEAWGPVLLFFPLPAVRTKLRDLLR